MPNCTVRPLVECDKRSVQQRVMAIRTGSVKNKPVSFINQRIMTDITRVSDVNRYLVTVTASWIDHVYALVTLIAG